MDLQQAASKLLKPLGFEVLELRISNSSKRLVLLRIDRLDQKAVSMDDVTLATKIFSLELDRLDPFDNSYKLEVQSPGPERPLITSGHFDRFQGLLVKVNTGGEAFKGKVCHVKENIVTFEVNNESRTIKITDIDSARLAQWPKSPR